APRPRPAATHPVLRATTLVMAGEPLPTRHPRLRLRPHRTRLRRLPRRLHAPHRGGHRLHPRRPQRLPPPRHLRRTLVPHLARRGHLVGEHGARTFGPPSATHAPERQGRMNVGEWAAVIGAAGSILGGGGWFVSRATRDAARATAAATEAAA